MSTEEQGLHASRAADVKHTKGPWYRDYVTEAISINTADGGPIATVWAFEAGEDAARANARLIAAAPELLEALTGVVDGIDDAWAGHFPERVEAVHAAIRKATT